MMLLYNDNCYKYEKYIQINYKYATTISHFSYLMNIIIKILQLEYPELMINKLSRRKKECMICRIAVVLSYHSKYNRLLDVTLNDKSASRASNGNTRDSSSPGKISNSQVIS